ncbi:MAG: 5-deoxy-glucuronate isomerase [Christensenellales bacterium]|jgi:5-deoxy-glucuronate isomerase
MKHIQKHPFDKGYNPIIDAAQEPKMKGLDFGIIYMEAGDKNEYRYPQEVVYTLLYGEVTFTWNDEGVTANRSDCFHEGAYVLHVPQNTEVKFECLSDKAEFAVCRTANSKSFDPKFLKPEDCLDANEVRGSGMMDDCATRLVRTFFDRSTCPNTNFFIGEVVHFPGKWSSYPPHIHAEPELYFYKMLPENGYGFSEYEGGAEIIRHNSLLGFESMTQHSQVVAPGYAMYYLWCIRLQDEKNIETIAVDEHKWVNQPGAKYFHQS